MYVIHIGVNEENLQRVKDIFPPSIVVWNGDGWNSWNEHLGEDINDFTTAHVLIGPWGDEEIARFMAAYVVKIDGKIESEEEKILVPMGGPTNQNGILACITDSEDWSEQVLGLRRPEALEHEWTRVDFSYASWLQCTCGFRPYSQAEMDAHIPSDHTANFS
jgi:hypothetical protein